jgi:hypothetical protein
MSQGPESETFLTQEERSQVKRYLSFPEEFPTELGSWIVDYMATNGQIPQSTVTGLAEAQRTADQALAAATAGAAAVAAAQAAAIAALEAATTAALAQIEADMISAAVAPSINTAEGTSSTSYTDLATVGPVLTGLADGTYVVLFGCTVFGGGTGGTDFGAHMGIQVNSTVATDAQSVEVGTNDTGIQVSGSIAVSVALANGTNTITAKYRSAEDDDFPLFSNRWLIALKVG